MNEANGEPAGDLGEWRALLLAAGAYLLVASAGAWPVLLHLGSRLWGDTGDAWQNLWNGWWLAEALRRGHWPFACDVLWHPDGVSLWLHTFGPLNALFTALLQATLPGFAGFNLQVLALVVAGATAAYLLCLDLLRAPSRGLPLLSRLPRWKHHLAAWVGGATLGLSPYVWGHAAVHLHLQSIVFLILFLRALERAGEGAASARWIAVLLAVATALVGWYLLVDEVLVGACLLGAALAAGRRGRARARRLAVTAAWVGVSLLPLLVPVLLAQREALDGTHDPHTFSLDLLAPVVPSAVQALGGPFRSLTARFTGNDAENAAALGTVAMALALLAALRLREHLPWRYLMAGVLGLALAVGPAPHLAGVPHPFLGWPYRLAEMALPPLRGLGCPVRFALLGNLAVAIAAAHGMVVLLAWAEGGGRGRRTLALALPALLVAELWPAPPPTSRYPAPDFLRALATAEGAGAVVDLTGWTHPLWNQMLHGRPIVHGYIARRPMRLLAKVRRDPVLGPLYEQALHGRAPRVMALRRVETRIGGRWGTSAPTPEVAADFELVYEGTLTVPRAGVVRFGLGSDDGAVLTLDGRVVVDNGGAHAYREREGRVTLAAGPHALRLRFQDLGGEAHLTLWAEGPGLPRGPLPVALLRAPDGSEGLLATYWHRVARPRLRGAAARRHLRQTWGVRWLIAYAGRLPAVVIRDLGLREIGRGEGLVLYEVPPVRPDP